MNLAFMLTRSQGSLVAEGVRGISIRPEWHSSTAMLQDWQPNTRTEHRSQRPCNRRISSSVAQSIVITSGSLVTGKSCLLVDSSWKA